MRNRSMTESQIARTVELYAEGKSLVHVGEALGFDDGTIHLALRRAGVRLRDAHGREP